MNPFTLSFEPELEREFFADYTARSLRFVRVTLVLAIGVTLAFVHWDQLLFPEVSGRLFAIRAAVISPVIALVAASTFSRRLQPYWQLGVALALATALGGLVAMMPILPGDAAQTHIFPGIQLVLMFAFAAFKLRFVHALVVSNAGVLLYFFVAAVVLEFPLPALQNAGYFLGWFVWSGLLTSYLLERFSRQDFLQRRENALLMGRLDEERATAIEANASKTRFLAAASHDLRQPMQTVGLLVDILREELPPGGARGLTERIHQATRAMESLFDGLLDISRLDAGSVPVAREVVSLRRMASSLHAKYEPLAERKRLALCFEGVDQRLETDPVLLERILGNLIDNAIKYTDRGSVTLRATIEGRIARLEVADTGEGIVPELQDRIFEEFFQVGNPERDRSKGLGIGLAIVRRTAALLGHPLGLRSTPGAGSVFSIEVPLARTVVLPLSSRAPDEAESAADAEAVRGLFVVVIDDERAIRESMAIVLEAWGCHALCAGGGLEAVEALAAHLRTPDLILSDYRLRGGENGLDAIARVRKASGLDVPAIVLTGDLDGAQLDGVREAGFPLARKPLHGAPLRSLIAETIRRYDPTARV